MNDVPEQHNESINLTQSELANFILQNFSKSEFVSAITLGRFVEERLSNVRNYTVEQAFYIFEKVYRHGFNIDDLLKEKIEVTDSQKHTAIKFVINCFISLYPKKFSNYNFSANFKAFNRKLLDEFNSLDDDYELAYTPKKFLDFIFQTSTDQQFRNTSIFINHFFSTGPWPKPSYKPNTLIRVIGLMRERGSVDLIELQKEGINITREEKKGMVRIFCRAFITLHPQIVEKMSLGKDLNPYDDKYRKSFFLRPKIAVAINNLAENNPIMQRNPHFSAIARLCTKPLDQILTAVKAIASKQPDDVHKKVAYKIKDTKRGLESIVLNENIESKWNTGYIPATWLLFTNFRNNIFFSKQETRDLQLFIETPTMLTVLDKLKTVCLYAFRNSKYAQDNYSIPEKSSASSFLDPNVTGKFFYHLPYYEKALRGTKAPAFNFDLIQDDPMSFLNLIESNEGGNLPSFLYYCMDVAMLNMDRDTLVNYLSERTNYSPITIKTDLLVMKRLLINILLSKYDKVLEREKVDGFDDVQYIQLTRKRSEEIPLLRNNLIELLKK